MQCVGVLFYLLRVTIVNGAILTWSKTYSYEAVLLVPEADVTIPYKVWVDGTSGQTRVDFYNGLDKFYRLRLYGTSQDYVFFKIYPEMTGTGINIEKCHKLSPGDTDMLQSYKANTYLPMRDFKYKGMEQLKGFNCQKWEYVIASEIYGYKVRFSNTIWVMLKVVGNEAVTVPVRYIYKSTAGNITLDFYIHEYVNFNDSEIDEAIFELPDELACGYQPYVGENEFFNPLLEYINPLYEHQKTVDTFEKYKMKHHKSYSSGSENLLRMKSFRNNLRLINLYNRQHNMFSLSVNHLTDLNDDELSKFLGTHDEDVTESDDNNTFDANTDEDRIFSDDNKDFDWRDYGVKSRVKDQTSMCGSCYAFAASGAMESAIFINNSLKDMREISEQAIIDCSWSADGNHGCRGGKLKGTLNWIKLYGIPFEHEYGHYLAMEGLCHISNMSKLVHISKYYKIKKDIYSIKRVLRKQGPLLLAVDGSPKSFIFYSKGIYNDEECSRESKFRNHALLLVGYGQEKGIDYWILKNSYGQSWGEEGYIRIAIQNNTCGVMNSVYSIYLSNM